MAQNNGLPTIADAMEVTGADGRFLAPVRMMMLKHPLIGDLVSKEGNLDNGEEFSSETALITPTYLGFNTGILATAGSNTKLTEKCTRLSARAAVDEDELARNGNSEQWRLDQAMKHLEAIYQEMERGFFYNTTLTNPDRFMGLKPRFDATNIKESKHVIPVTGSPSGSVQNSIWLVVHGLDSCYQIFPRGTKGGVSAIDIGRFLLDDGTGTGASFRAFVTDWVVQFGLVVKDWRQIVRMPNIDTALVSPTGFDLIPAMTKAVNRVENINGGRAVFYMNRFVMETLDLQCQNNSRQAALEKYIEEGVPRTSFRGVPIHVTDALTSTEAIVV